VSAQSQANVHDNKQGTDIVTRSADMINVCIPGHSPIIQERDILIRDSILILSLECGEQS